MKPELIERLRTLKLIHGTTRQRAERLLGNPPDDNFIEPGATRSARAGGFSTVPAGATETPLGTAADYARGKHNLFPNEGGPVILEVDVPEWIVDILRNDPIAA